MNKPRVALVFTGLIKTDSFFGFLLPSLGLERLGAMVTDIAQVELFDRRFEDNLIDEIVAFNPTVIALNVKTTMYALDSFAIARELRKCCPEALIVCGGLHATTSPQETLQFCHYVMRGEGELTFRSLIECVISENSPKGIPGLAYRDESGLYAENPMGKPLADLDHLPPPARHLRKPSYQYSAAGLIKMDLLETSRGCTHACSFCSSGSVYPTKYRYHSPAYVIDEVERLAAAGVKYCMLTDDHSGGDMKRMEEICLGIIERDIHIAFFTFIRPFTGNMELKKLMVQAGFVLLSYGAESPDENQLKRYGKGFSESAEFIHTVNQEWLAAGACYIGNSYVFGDVNESRAVLESIGVFARQLDSTYIEPLYSQPYPGTPYRRELAAKNQLKNRKWSDFTEGRLLVEHPELNEAEMARLRANMWLDFFSPRKVAGIFRVPLHFYHVLKLPVVTILRYMRACEYSVFGCVLEDKFYHHLWAEMVETWFKEKLHTFEEHEMNVHENFADFLEMVGLKFWMKRQINRTWAISVYENREHLASLCLIFKEGELVGAHVQTELPSSTEIPLSKIEIPLADLITWFTVGNSFGKMRSFFSMVTHNLLRRPIQVFLQRS